MNMSSTVDRLRKLVSENLEVDGEPISLPEDLNVSLVDSGVSSVDLVAFGRLVAQEFNVKFTLDDCSNLNSVQSLIEHLDARAG
jgi:acyl carrier protein